MAFWNKDWSERVSALLDQARAQLDVERYDEASECFSRAFEIVETDGDETHPVFASLIGLYADFCLPFQPEGALNLYRRLLECGQALNHPIFIANSLRGCGEAQLRLGDGSLDEVLDGFAQARALLENEADLDAERLRADIDELIVEADAAKQAFARALSNAYATPSSAPSQTTTASSAANSVESVPAWLSRSAMLTESALGALEDARHHEAMQAIQAALQLVDLSGGHEHPEFARVLLAAADIVFFVAAEAALPLYQRVLAQAEFGGKPFLMADALLGCGKAQLAMGAAPKVARSSLERAQALLSTLGGDAVELMREDIRMWLDRCDDASPYWGRR